MRDDPCPRCTPTISTDGYDRPSTGLLCHEHWRAKLAEGLTADDWARLHRMAVQDYHPWKPAGEVPHYPKLPPAPKPPVLTKEKHQAQILKVFAQYPNDKCVDHMIGRPYPTGGHVVGTNGHMMLLGPGQGIGAPLQVASPPLGETRTVHLEKDFALVLRRAASVAKPTRTGATTLTCTHEGILVTAKDHDYDAAAETSELYPCTVPEALDQAAACFDITYLQAMLGRYPITWRVPVGEKVYPARPPLVREERYPAAGHLCSRFDFLADDTSVLLMPMRI